LEASRCYFDTAGDQSFIVRRSQLSRSTSSNTRPDGEGTSCLSHTDLFLEGQRSGEWRFRRAVDALPPSRLLLSRDAVGRSMPPAFTTPVLTIPVTGRAPSGFQARAGRSMPSRGPSYDTSLFSRLVLGWIDSYDSNQILIFSGFSRSTKLSG
jgi:hypothetical protein